MHYGNLILQAFQKCLWGAITCQTFTAIQTISDKIELPDSLLDFFSPQMILKLDAVNLKKQTLKK